MNSIGHGMVFDLKCLFWTLLINIGLCLLLAYKMLTMSIAAPEQLTELRSILEENLDEKERKTLLSKLFEVVSEREETRKSLRALVFKFSIGMLPLLITGLVLVYRVMRRTKAVRYVDGMTQS